LDNYWILLLGIYSEVIQNPYYENWWWFKTFIKNFRFTCSPNKTKFFFHAMNLVSFLFQLLKLFKTLINFKKWLLSFSVSVSFKKFICQGFIQILSQCHQIKLGSYKVIIVFIKEISVIKCDTNKHTSV